VVINFATHEARQGRAGATEDFENMLALLVNATEGEGRLVWANPGDWGIDVLVGELDGVATILQAKYFRGVGKSQQAQIGHSFASAQKAASENGHRVGRWVLCVPASMDAPMTRWWGRWKRAREQETGTTIELWDETALRERLLDPRADHVRRAFYGPFRHDSVEDRERSVGVATIPVTTASALARCWRGGEEIQLGDALYLLHDDAHERSARDRTWVWREATADRVDPTYERVYLRQVQIVRAVGDGHAPDRREELRVQAQLVGELNGRAGLPRLVALHDEPGCTTVATTHPPGMTWSRAFGPAPGPLDRFMAASVVVAATDVCTGLAELHRRRHAHGLLDSDAIVVEHGRRAFLRDVGLAGLTPWPPSSGEQGTYRAPEQLRLPFVSDARSDVFGLAALVYHTVTAHPPAPDTTPPARVSVGWLPASLDDVLQRALSADPDRRPTISELARAFGQARHELTQSSPL
jgi:hypothetical protein